VLVDGVRAMCGSKNIDADRPEEIMFLLEGPSFVEACRQDFAAIWGAPLPSLSNPPSLDAIPGSVPIIMMGRTESGSIREENWRSPQNVGWRTMMDVAEKEVYLHTMIFNAQPMFDKVIDTVKRGVNVTMVLTYKYGDLAVRMDKRGLGHNRGTVTKLFASLVRYPAARQRLRVCWWIGLHQKDKTPYPEEKDWTHAKALIVDKRMASVGSANMDTMSVYNQREANFMFDDETVATQIYDRLVANQLSLDNCYHFSK